MHKDRLLFFDCQVFQSAAWDRGMGKYSLDIIKAITRDSNYSYKKTFLVFTKRIGLSEEVVQTIIKAMPNAELLIADLAVPDDPSTENIPAMQSRNEAALKEIVEKKKAEYSVEEVDYAIMSLFIDQVCSVFPPNTKNILLFYDLIPLQYYERYSKLSSYDNYLARFKTMFEADLIWTISQTVADDLSLNLGLDPEILCNIEGAPINRTIGAPRKPQVAIPDKFILVPSGNDIRKNNIRAVQGFEAYRRQAEDKDICLLLTSSFDENTQKTLLSYSHNLIFTGNVSEAELQWLYQHTKALLFVTEYEGLGLPILEAAEANKPIVCSNIAVFNEISDEAFYFADPYDVEGIADSLAKAINLQGFTAKQQRYGKILEHYTWENSARVALAALDGLVKQNLAGEPKKPRLAVFAPSPSSYSDIGKRAAQVHGQLHKYFEIDYYLEAGRITKGFSRPNYLPYVAQCYEANQFSSARYRDYDAVLYHIGNSEFHLETIKNALYLPGYAILHDTHLENIFKVDLQHYGYITKERYDAETLLQKSITDTHSSYLTSILNKQLLNITHSGYANKAVTARELQQGNSVSLQLPVATPNGAIKKLDKSTVVIGFAGIIHPAKGLDVLEAIVQADEMQDCKIHIFGLSLVSPNILSALAAYPNVSIDTDVTDFQFQNMLSGLDVLVNFRKDYRGETSAATLEAMRFGVVPVVRNVGWYSELADDCAVKVDKVADVIDEIAKLVNDAARRSRMSANAKKYVKDRHSYAQYAKALHGVIVGDTVVSETNRIIQQGLQKR